jgi:hypothetical protein
VKKVQEHIEKGKDILSARCRERKEPSCGESTAA